MTTTSPAVLGTIDDDGSPHLVPVMFHHVDAEVIVETNSSSRKARNVARRAEATVLVQTDDPAWVCGRGPATIVSGHRAARLNARLRAKYLTDEGEHACGPVLATLDDVSIVVTPTRWSSWTMDALFSTIVAGGADPERVHRWFRGSP